MIWNCDCSISWKREREGELAWGGYSEEQHINNDYYNYDCGPGSSVGILTDYELDGPGSNPGGDEIFTPSRPFQGPTQPPVKWVPGLSRG